MLRIKEIYILVYLYYNDTVLNINYIKIIIYILVYLYYN